MIVGLPESGHSRVDAYGKSLGAFVFLFYWAVMSSADGNVTAQQNTTM